MKWIFHALGFAWLLEHLSTLIGLWCIGLCGCLLNAGCADQQKFAQSMTFLQEGKARGHLVLTSDARLAGTVETTFSGGANKSALSFDGDVNFADTVRHVTEQSGTDVEPN